MSDLRNDNTDAQMQRADTERVERVVVNRDYGYAEHIEDGGRPVRRISWGSVLAGALIALMSTLLLSLLASGLGLKAFDPANSADPLGGNGVGTGITFIVINLVSLLLGSYVAGRMANSPRRGDGMIHGVLTWGTLTLLALSLLGSTAGRLIGGVTNLMGSTVSSVSQGVAAAAPDNAQQAQNMQQSVTNAVNQLPGVTNVQNEVDKFLADNGIQNPEQAGQELLTLVTTRIQNGESLTSNAAQEELKTWIADNSDLSEADVEQKAQAFAQAVDQTQQDVTQGVQQAADTTGNAALWGFLGLLLGALVSAGGAAAGSPKDAEEARAV